MFSHIIRHYLFFAVLIRSKTEILNLQSATGKHFYKYYCHFLEYILCVSVLMCNGNPFYRFIFNTSAKTAILLLLRILLDIYHIKLSTSMSFVKYFSYRVFLFYASFIHLSQCLKQHFFNFVFVQFVIS